MVVLSIDIGKTMGICIADQNTILHEQECYYESPSQFYRMIKDVIVLWKPSVVIYPAPTRFYNTMRIHWKMIGVIDLICDQLNIGNFEVIDSSCKKAVLGKGNAKKENIREYYGEAETSEHVLDARMFKDYYFKQLKQKRTI